MIWIKTIVGAKMCCKKAKHSDKNYKYAITTGYQLHTIGQQDSSGTGERGAN